MKFRPVPTAIVALIIVYVVSCRSKPKKDETYCSMCMK